MKATSASLCLLFFVATFVPSEESELNYFCLLRTFSWHLLFLFTFIKHRSVCLCDKKLGYRWQTAQWIYAMFSRVADHENATYVTAPYSAGILSPNAEASGGPSVGYWLLMTSWSAWQSSREYSSAASAIDDLELRIVFQTAIFVSRQGKWKKVLRETQTLHAGCSKTEPNIPPPQTFPGVQ